MKRATPPWSGLGRRIESMVRKALHDYQMLQGVSRLTVALSGGKDSLALLSLLHAISGRGFPAFELSAIHIHGPFSCGAGVEVAALQKLCDEMHVPLCVKKQQQKREGLACYSCSRERRRLLFETAKEMGTETIAFGHHRDDLVQTLLMNLLHKGEFAGTLPKLRMHEYGVTILRPLIYVSEEEIRSFAQMYGFARIVCRCPVGQRSMRRETERLLSDLEELFPHARKNLARAALTYGSDKAARKTER